MAINIKYLELHLGEVITEVEAIESLQQRGAFSNKKLNDYASSLIALKNRIISTDFSTMTPNDLEHFRDILKFISKSCQYLKSTTVNDLPSPLFACLREALRDWTKDEEWHRSKDFVIAALKSDYETHYYSQPFFDDGLKDDIKNDYGVIFNHKIIPLGYPSYLERDYLNNLSLYHELGHFVDLSEWKFSEKMVNNIYLNHNLPLSDVYFKEIDLASFFDNNSPYHESNVYRLFYYLREYFADIFAAQYIGYHKNHRLLYIVDDPNMPHSEHPSLISRINAINNFVSGPPNHDEFISWMVSEISSISSKQKQLEIKSIPLDDSSPLYEGNPVMVRDTRQFHSVLSLAWELWLNPNDSLKDKWAESRDPKICYMKINSLIEKSINSYNP